MTVHHEKQAPLFIKHLVIFAITLFLIAVSASLISYSNALAYIYEHHFPLSVHEASMLSTIYLTISFLFQIPSGLLIDRIGVHRSIFLTIIIFIIGFILFSCSQNLTMFVFSSAVMGVGSGITFVLVIYTAKMLFKTHLLTMLVGLGELFFSLALAISPYVLKVLYYIMPWRATSLILAAILLLLSLFYFFSRLYRCEIPTPPHLVVHNASASNIKALSSFRFWYISIVAGIFYTHFVLLTEMYGPTYIHLVYKLSYVQSVFVNDGAVFGYMIGCLLLGPSEKLIPIRALFFITALCAALTYSVVAFHQPLLHHHYALRYVIYSLLGFFSAYPMLAFRLYEVVSGRHLNATLGAAINVICGLLPLSFSGAYMLCLDTNYAYAGFFIFTFYCTATVLSLVILFMKPPRLKA